MRIKRKTKIRKCVICGNDMEVAVKPTKSRLPRGILGSRRLTCSRLCSRRRSYELNKMAKTKNNKFMCRYCNKTYQCFDGAYNCPCKKTIKWNAPASQRSEELKAKLAIKGITSRNLKKKPSNIKKSKKKHLNTNEY